MRPLWPALAAGSLFSTVAVGLRIQSLVTPCPFDRHGREIVLSPFEGRCCRLFLNRWPPVSVSARRVLEARVAIADFLRAAEHSHLESLLKGTESDGCQALLAVLGPSGWLALSGHKSCPPVLARLCVELRRTCNTGSGRISPPAGLLTPLESSAIQQAFLWCSKVLCRFVALPPDSATVKTLPSTESRNALAASRNLATMCSATPAILEMDDADVVLHWTLESLVHHVDQSSIKSICTEYAGEILRTGAVVLANVCETSLPSLKSQQSRQYKQPLLLPSLIDSIEALHRVDDLQFAPQSLRELLVGSLYASVVLSDDDDSINGKVMHAIGTIVGTTENPQQHARWLDSIRHHFHALWLFKTTHLFIDVPVRASTLSKPQCSFDLASLDFFEGVILAPLEQVHVEDVFRRRSIASLKETLLGVGGHSTHRRENDGKLVRQDAVHTILLRLTNRDANPINHGDEHSIESSRIVDTSVSDGGIQTAAAESARPTDEGLPKQRGQDGKTALERNSMISWAATQMASLLPAQRMSVLSDSTTSASLPLSRQMDNWSYAFEDEGGMPIIASLLRGGPRSLSPSLAVQRQLLETYGASLQGETFLLGDVPGTIGFESKWGVVDVDSLPKSAQPLCPLVPSLLDVVLRLSRDHSRPEVQDRAVRALSTFANKLNGLNESPARRLMIEALEQARLVTCFRGALDALDAFASASKDPRCSEAVEATQHMATLELERWLPRHLKTTENAAVGELSLPIVSLPPFIRERFISQFKAGSAAMKRPALSSMNDATKAAGPLIGTTTLSQSLSRSPHNDLVFPLLAPTALCRLHALKALAWLASLDDDALRGVITESLLRQGVIDAAASCIRSERSRLDGELQGGILPSLSYRPYRTSISVARQCARLIANQTEGLVSLSLCGTEGDRSRVRRMAPSLRDAIQELQGAASSASVFGDAKLVSFTMRAAANAQALSAAQLLEKNPAERKAETFGGMLYPIFDGRGIYEQPPRDGSIDGVDIVLIHGLSGSAFKTWRKHSPEAEGLRPPELPSCVKNGKLFSLWPVSLLAADDFRLDPAGPASIGNSAHMAPSLRVVAVGYSSDLFRNPLKKDDPLPALSKRMVAELVRAGIGSDPHRRVVFLVHSMGGLMLKMGLLDPIARGLAANTAGIVFYATPHGGSKWAQAVASVGGKGAFSPQVQAIGDLESLRSLNRAFGVFAAETGLRISSLAEGRPTAVLGIEGGAVSRVTPLVVSLASADPGYGDFKTVPLADHVSVCKPNTRDDVRYQLARDAVACALTRHAI